MPTTTPNQKIKQVEMHGREFVEIVLAGDTFDDSYNQAVICAEEEGRTFIHPFDDEKVMAGQGTVAVEILNDCEEKIDYVFASIGGGGLNFWIKHVYQKCFTRNKNDWCRTGRCSFHEGFNWLNRL